MLKLLIIADDFTGALDTGVRYAECGAITKVIVKKELDFYKADCEGVEVLVLNVESRHLEASIAYEIIRSVVAKAKEYGVPHIYKKTDSGLRGNVESELVAMLYASGENFLPFVPAFPEMNRITRNGIHYIDGLRLQDSVYGSDPFEPVHISYIPDLFKSYDIDVEVIKADCSYSKIEKEKIGVFDGETEDDLRKIANYLHENNRLAISAGCAGFATVLLDVLGLRKTEKRSYQLPKRLFVACGSVNVISKEQLDFAQEHGFYRMTINPGKHLREGYLESSAGKKWINRLKYYYTRERSCILDTTTENIKKMTEGEKQGLKLARVEVGNLMGKIMKNLLDCNVDNTVLIVGGDTLLEFFECMHCDEIIPISEIKPGLVLSELYIENKKRWVISKSGGFGNKELLVELWDEICSERI